jgi:hypothetical protein
VLEVYAQGFDQMSSVHISRSLWGVEPFPVKYIEEFDYLTALVSGREHWRQIKFNPRVYNAGRLRALPWKEGKMNSDTLSGYLAGLQASSLPFSREEINEFVIVAYDVIEWAIRDQCDVIEILPESVLWRKAGDEGNAVGTFSTPTSLKPYYEMIVNRDRVLQKHLRLEEETDTTAKYRIV